MNFHKIRGTGSCLKFEASIDMAVSVLTGECGSLHCFNARADLAGGKPLTLATTSSVEYTLAVSFISAEKGNSYEISVVRIDFVNTIHFSTLVPHASTCFSLPFF